MVTRCLMALMTIFFKKWRHSASRLEQPKCFNKNIIDYEKIIILQNAKLPKRFHPPATSIEAVYPV